LDWNRNFYLREDSKNKLNTIPSHSMVPRSLGVYRKSEENGRDFEFSDWLKIDK